MDDVQERELEFEPLPWFSRRQPSGLRTWLFGPFYLGLCTPWTRSAWWVLFADVLTVGLARWYFLFWIKQLVDIIEGPESVDLSLGVVDIDTIDCPLEGYLAPKQVRRGEYLVIESQSDAEYVVLIGDSETIGRIPRHAVRILPAKLEVKRIKGIGGGDFVCLGDGELEVQVPEAPFPPSPVIQNAARLVKRRKRSRID